MSSPQQGALAPTGSMSARKPDACFTLPNTASRIDASALLFGNATGTEQCGAARRIEWFAGDRASDWLLEHIWASAQAPSAGSSGDTIKRDVVHAGAERSSRLAVIQGALGLTTQQLADVLRISRAQLYKWMDPDRSLALQSQSRRRFRAIEQLARRWGEQSRAVLGQFAIEPLGSGHTVLDLLKSETLDITAIYAAFDELLSRMTTRSSSLSERLRARGFASRFKTTLPPDE